MRKPTPGKTKVSRKPLFRFVLNPFTDYRCTRCPRCNALNKVRKVPLVIHMEPDNLCVLQLSVLLCPACNILILHQDRLEEKLAAAYGEIVRGPVGNPYFLLGTMEPADWRRTLKESTPAEELLALHHPFKSELELRVTLPGWFPAGSVPIQRTSFDRGAPRSLGESPPNANPSKCFRLRISLEGIAPEIWRTLYVPVDIQLPALHQALQAVMGWEDYHLHLFRINGRDYVIPGDDRLENEVDEQGVRLSEVVQEGGSFTYQYDFGDNWNHTVTVEATAQGLVLRPPVCTSGARSCPPEDCGGVDGYRELLRVLSNPQDKEHQEMRAWVGRRFDPDRFDLERSNRRLSGLRL